MIKRALTFVMFMLAFTIARCQRVVQPFSAPSSDHFFGVPVGNEFWYSNRFSTQIHRYDGAVTTAFNYPIRAGEQLYYASPEWRRPFSDRGLPDMVSYRSSVYLLLTNLSRTRQYLYQFDGTSFLPVSIGGVPVSNLVIYQDNLYVMFSGDAGVKLYTVNGHSLIEVPGSAMMTSHEYKLNVGGNYLYAEGQAAGHPVADYTKRFDGTSFTPLTDFPTYSSIMKVIPVPGTDKAYFKFDDETIYYYDGTTATPIAVASTLLTFGLEFMNDEFYYIQDEGYTNRLFRVNGAEKTEIIPPGAVAPSEITVFRNKLYFSVFDPGRRLYTYDGVSFDVVPGIPSGSTYTREGRMLVMTMPASSYDGTRFTEVSAPFEDYCWMDKFDSPPCFNVWSVYRDSPTGYHFVLAKEIPDVDCVPPTTPDPVSVISEDLHDYDHFVMGVAGRERDWCWTGIDVDWDYLCYPFPCIDPIISTTLKDANGKVAWQKSFDKPFNTSISLPDTQPYTLSLAVEKNKVMNDVLVLDNNLVQKGIDGITLDMYPKQDYFYLTVSTEKDVTIPFTMTLKSSQGKSLWQRSYTAPMDQLIREYVPKAGDYLQFSLETVAASSGVTYYPNPSDGKFSILVSANSQPVSVSVSDFNGKVIAQNDHLTAGETVFEIPNHHPGLYVLTVAEGKAIRKELIMVK